MATKYMNYDMIQKYTELPQFPEIRTRILYAFLNQSNTMQENSELFSLVTSLVQVGLETHDSVSITNEAKDIRTARSRQIKVLAGDYFSACFYSLLAKSGHIQLIGALAEAICEANRLKLTLYETMKTLKMPADEYLKQSIEVRMQLYLAFTPFMQSPMDRIWPEILRLFTQGELLLQEVGRMEKEQPILDSWSFWYLLQHTSKEERKLMQVEEPDQGKLRSLWMKYKISAQLYQMLLATSRQLQEKLHNLDLQEFSKELLSIGEPFVLYLSTPKALEEI
ncbi:heptaprenyl diphosphate synthase component 1 [Paenibacillus agricola]|nr:heptaprenyl diphosphate synthase component 1 [Paenibacillus agricola]